MQTESDQCQWISAFSQMNSQCIISIWAVKERERHITCGTRDFPLAYFFCIKTKKSTNHKMLMKGHSSFPRENCEWMVVFWMIFCFTNFGSVCYLHRSIFGKLSFNFYCISNGRSIQEESIKWCCASARPSVYVYVYECAAVERSKRW